MLAAYRLVGGKAMEHIGRPDAPVEVAVALTTLKGTSAEHTAWVASTAVGTKAWMAKAEVRQTDAGALKVAPGDSIAIATPFELETWLSVFVEMHQLAPPVGEVLVFCSDVYLGWDQGCHEIATVVGVDEADLLTVSLHVLRHIFCIYSPRFELPRSQDFVQKRYFLLVR